MYFRFLQSWRQQVCLRTDHHHLTLEKCNADLECLEVIAEHYFESLDELGLAEWLAEFPKLKRVQLTLLLNDAVCEWSDDMEPKDPDIFATATVDLLQTQKRVAVEKASIDAYLSAAKHLKLKLKRVAPEGEKAVNFLKVQQYGVYQKRHQNLIWLSLTLMLLLSIGVIVLQFDQLAQLKQQQLAVGMQQENRQPHKIIQHPQPAVGRIKTAEGVLCVVQEKNKVKLVRRLKC